MPPKLTIEKVRKEFKNTNYALITTKYINSRQSFKFLCNKGHEGKMRLDHLRGGIKCSKCAGNRRLTIKYVTSSFNKEGYNLLTTEYINSSTKLEYICPEGHNGSISWNNWSTGNRCMECFGTQKKELSYVKEYIEKDGYTVLDTEYLNSKSLLTLICPEGHQYKVSWDNWKTNNSRCPRCSKTGVSLDEIRLQEYVCSLVDTVTLNDRTLIKPYELDIVIPEKKIAIEYCGLYWHSELMGKDRRYHAKKEEMCKELGYKLITIFEDEWLVKTDIVKSRLSVILNSGNTVKVFARKCEIRKISFKDAKTFFTNNHLQGYAIASIRIGLFYNSKLIATMTFAKSPISKGSKIALPMRWELSRFCVSKWVIIVGGASKLLKYFEINYDWKFIFSYADLRWSSGNLYNKLNFTYDYKTKPNYWYFKNNKKRIHRSVLRKNTSDLQNKTEWENRISQKWNRIWDCGNLKFSKVNNNKGKVTNYIV